MKKFYSFIILVAALFLIWRFANPLIEKIAGRLPQAVKNFASSSLPSQLGSLGDQIFAPPPLRGGSASPGNTLTRGGVIEQTNINRGQNGNLPPLTENQKLDKAALSKLNDMFKLQYFEHVNPAGKGPSDLAHEATYAYISIGENLALGNFDGDQALVQAWMNSPGHRANILNNKFTEMGAAVGQGIFEGKSTWLAVQEFGRPASSCPSVDSDLKIQINSLQSDVNQLQAQLAQAKSQIDNNHPQTQSDYDGYNQKVAAYNDAIKIYNNKVDSLKLVTAQYNGEVSAYNSCLGS